MFCGSKLKVIKKASIAEKDKIIVSTCYFPNYLHKFDKLNGRNLDYINNLIANIETFDMKVQRFTSNPEKWVYRVYLDETIFHLTEIIENILNPHDLKQRQKKTKTRRFKNIRHYSKSLKDKSNNEIIDELDAIYTMTRNNIINNYEILIFIEKLMTKYIDIITSSKDSKYANIEIISYTSHDYSISKLSDSHKYITGLIETYGTLFRFHPCQDKDASVVIMRNCSHILTPLDIMIQNYWIERETNLEFMEYFDKKYDFTADSDLSLRKEWYETFYNSAKNTKQEKINKIRHFGYDRVMAGLISCKINGKYHTAEHYASVFENLYKKMQDSIGNEKLPFVKLNKIDLFTYGIDEAVINYIFPTLRSGSYRLKDIKNPENLVENTFAIKLFNRECLSSCNNCNKPEFLDLITRKLGSEKEEDKSKNITPTDKKIKRQDKQCCLNDIYMKDSKFYNMPGIEKINKTTPLIWDLDKLRTLPFKKLDMNTWRIPNISIMVVLGSVIFINKYNFALRYNQNIPKSIKRSFTRSLSNNNNIDNAANSNKPMDGGSIKHNSKKAVKAKKYKVEIDKHLIICNVKNKNLDKEVNKYLSGVKDAYSPDNFYPVLIYSAKLTVFTYTNSHYISINKILEPVKFKHGFNF